MKNQYRGWQVASHLVLGLFSLACILPFALLFISSITDDKAIVRDGYSFFPSEFSFGAYEYLWKNSDTILHAYGITILITVVGTVTSLAITSLLAYPLSRRDLPGGKALAFIVFFTLLFNGGLVPTYMVYTKVFELQNTLWAQLIPWLLMNGFNVLLMRAFFTNTIPTAVIESASIDGASEFKIYYRIILQLSLPILATIGLFQALAFWNDWNNGLIFINDPNLLNLQNVLNRIMSNIEFLSMNSSMGATDALAMLPKETFRMAIAVVAIVPILLAYPFFQKYFVKGLMIGAVKG
ncbi:sugar ABC transporter permease [Cohnella sp. CIP 111063]|jgi:putative aldouronate transport system permease protein|uniref:carbohydrate ABC transporter permease n=1 Tax=unclassified Cohnella TaxID=2636738 RepID=UPI000B8C1B3F|nr:MULTISPECIES: carbohydrate ABC transporter permease [unclassified Cohnella]OXS52861.1 sugar ABC transporter permease [Cohnella sp. CIP 111063]PRX59834.1 putative aldouronate transport system permease protein [Cohnella sp. SGD-V74]